MTGMQEILPGLYLGDYQAASNLEVLKEASITHILIAAEECSARFPEQFTYKKVGIADSLQTSLGTYIQEALAYVRQAIEAGGKVLIHCAAGVSRSASLVIAYVMQEKQWGMAQALSWVREKRPVISPNPSFMRQLGEWEETVTGRRKQLRCGNCQTGLECQSEAWVEDSVKLESLPACLTEQFNSLFCFICGWQVGVRTDEGLFLLRSQLDNRE